MIVTNEFSWPYRPAKTLRVDGKTIYAPFYFRWRAMLYRCYSEKSHEVTRYKNRGIKVCKEWHEFFNFYDWCCGTYETGKTIDRINNDGDYCPENCRWATPLQQALNARVTDERIKGIKKAQKAQRNWQIGKFGNPKTRIGKKCFSCGIYKLNKSYNKSKARSDGLQGRCRECSNDRNN